MVSKIDVSIVIPTYRERDNIEILIPQIMDVFKKNKIRGEIIVIDDNSRDGTAELVRDFSGKCNGTCEIRLIEREDKLGLGSAYREGFRRAKGEVIFEMDGDLSHDPYSIPEFLNKIHEGNSLVIGSRYMNGGGINNWSFFRKLTSRGANFLANQFIRLNVKDATSGYRAYKRDLLDKLNLQDIKSDGYSFQVEMVYLARKMGFKIAEVPILFKDRQTGKSKLGMKEVLNFFIIVLKLTFEKFFNHKKN